MLGAQPVQRDLACRIAESVVLIARRMVLITTVAQAPISTGQDGHPVGNPADRIYIITIILIIIVVQ